MKLPSFIKLPDHKKFTIAPRYYDPIKEEIMERTEIIKRKMSGEENFEVKAHKITFDRRASPGPNTSGLQILIALILGSSFLGWLNYGNSILYLLWLILPVYLFLKFKKKRAKR